VQPTSDRRLRALLGETLALDPRRRVDAVRSLPASLAPDEADPLVAEGWDRVLELVDDPEPVVRRTVLHVLAAEAPARRADDVERALHRLSEDTDESLRRRARKVHAQFRRARAA
jgi:hypothetical protein